uniref:Uncharacterized protein n=1 Tax=Haptolina ericina TaxID=156174 RepID=A0A7S3AJE8_9EUKA
MAAAAGAGGEGNQVLTNPRVTGAVIGRRFLPAAVFCRGSLGSNEFTDTSALEGTQVIALTCCVGSAGGGSASSKGGEHGCRGCALGVSKRVDRGVSSKTVVCALSTRPSESSISWARE